MAIKSSAKAADAVRCKVEVKHEFTVEEYKERTTELTTKMKNVEIREDTLKAQQATAKAEIKALKADVNDIANQLRNGFENISVDATVEFHRKKGSKSYFWFCPGKPDHKKLIRIDPMSEEDFQSLPFDGEAQTQQPKPKTGETGDLLDKMQENQVTGGEAPRVRSGDEPTTE